MTTPEEHARNEERWQRERDHEQLIVRTLIRSLLAKGYTLGVNDGGATTVANSRDEATIWKALRTTEQDTILVNTTARVLEGERQIGWVQLVYGNGVDLISDYTTNLEDALREINDLVARLEAQG